MSTNKAAGKEVRPPRRIRVIMKTGDNIKDWRPPKRSRIERVQIIDGGDDDSFGMEAVRNKLMLDLETEVEMMRSTILKKSKKEEEEAEHPPPRAAAASACRWGLRSRTKQVEEKEKHRVCVPLSRSEIEQDFMKMTGSLLPRKPNKRPNVVQKQMDTLFPGLSLTHVTADLYKVPEPPCFASLGRPTPRRRPRTSRRRTDIEIPSS